MENKKMVQLNIETVVKDLQNLSAVYGEKTIDIGDLMKKSESTIEHMDKLTETIRSENRKILDKFAG